MYTPPNIRGNYVFVSMDLHQILEVDEKEGFVKAQFFYVTCYFVEDLDWTAEVDDADAPSEIWLPEGTLWTPQMVFSNAIRVIKMTSEQYANVSGFACPIRTVITVKFHCSFNLRHFPFDTQASETQAFKAF